MQGNQTTINASAATTVQIAKIFGCTEAQVRAQFSKNAKQLRGMEGRAKGGKYRGYTAEHCGSLAAMAESKA